MKSVIKNIALQNFKGCRNATYTFDGKNVTVCGANGSGKTTIFDARMEWFYCLVLQIYLAKDLEDGLYQRERMIIFVKTAKKILVINAYAIAGMKK